MAWYWWVLAVFLAGGALQSVRKAQIIRSMGPEGRSIALIPLAWAAVLFAALFWVIFG